MDAEVRNEKKGSQVFLFAKFPNKMFHSLEPADQANNQLNQS